MHAFAVTANQVVPAGQGVAIGNQTVTAGMRQPIKREDIGGGDFDAIGHIGVAVGVVAAGE